MHGISKSQVFAQPMHCARHRLSHCLFCADYAAPAGGEVAAVRAPELLGRPAGVSAAPGWRSSA